MASTPTFPSAGRLGRAVLSAATTDKTGATTTNIVDIAEAGGGALAGVAAGTRISRLVIQADGDPADCTVLIFLHNGTDYRLFHEFDIGNPAASTTAVAAYREEIPVEDLVLPSASWKIAAAITVVPTAGSVNVWAHGVDLT